MKKTILFVDDEEINLFVLARRFESDYHVLTANSAKDAIKIIKNEAIDAIISDVKMPDISGLEMIEQVKDHLENTPCFLLTGYDQNDEIDEAMQKKLIAEIFKKPFSYNEISLTLEEYL